MVLNESKEHAIGLLREFSSDLKSTSKNNMSNLVPKILRSISAESKACLIDKGDKDILKDFVIDALEEKKSDDTAADDSKGSTISVAFVLLCTVLCTFVSTIY